MGGSLFFPPRIPTMKFARQLSSGPSKSVCHPEGALATEGSGSPYRHVLKTVELGRQILQVVGLLSD